MRLDPKYNTRPDDPKFMDAKETPLTEGEATYYLKTAWKNIYGDFPTTNSLALLWAQSCGETGRWKMLRCNNWGNIKKRKNNKTLNWTSYDAGENMTIAGVFGHYMFYPYHPQTHFVAFDNPLDGADYYIRFLSQRKRYRRAWAEVMSGDPVAYSRELKKAGYFTADLDHYTRGVVSLTKEFKRKSDDLLAFAPPEPIPAPEPPSEPEPEPEPIPEPGEQESSPEPAPEPENQTRTIMMVIIDFIKKMLGMG